MGKKTKSTSRRAHGKAPGRRRPGASPAQRNHLGPFDDVCRQFVSVGGAAILASRDPLEAEGWASHVLGVLAALTLVGEPDTTAAIGGRLVSVAGRQRSIEGQVCLRALAAVAAGPLGDRALRAAARGGRGGEPGWFAAIGAARPTEAWRASDVWGDQDSIMVGFVYPSGAEHTLLVLVDHALGGIAKDAAILESPITEVMKQWDDDDPGITVVSEPVEVAAGRVIEAMGWTDRTVDPPVNEDYPEAAALLRARFAPLASSVASAVALDAEGREDLVRTFLAAPEGEAYAEDPQAWFLLDVLVDYRCDQPEGDPLRWGAGATQVFLLDWVPRKLSAGDITLGRAPEILRAWARWGAGHAGLPPKLAEESLDTIDAIEDEFHDAIADPANWGPAKQLAMRMLDAGVDLSDVDEANRWLFAQGLHI